MFFIRQKFQLSKPFGRQTEISCSIVRDPPSVANINSYSVDYKFKSFLGVFRDNPKKKQNRYTSCERLFLRDFITNALVRVLLSTGGNSLTISLQNVLVKRFI